MVGEVDCSSLALWWQILFQLVWQLSWNRMRVAHREMVFRVSQVRPRGLTREKKATAAQVMTQKVSSTGTPSKPKARETSSLMRTPLSVSLTFQNDVRKPRRRRCWSFVLLVLWAFYHVDILSEDLLWPTPTLSVSWASVSCALV